MWKCKGQNSVCQRTAGASTTIPTYLCACSPPFNQIELLAKILCFATDGRGSTPSVAHLDGRPGLREVPSFKAKRPAGGHSATRPTSWEPAALDLEHLWRTNTLDLDLFVWASDRTRDRLLRLVEGSSSSSSGWGVNEVFRGASGLTGFGTGRGA